MDENKNENEEQPKAMTNMSKENDSPKALKNEKDEKVEKKSEVENNEKEPKVKDKFKTKYVVFLIALIGITAGATYLTIQQIDTQKPNENPTQPSIVQPEQNRKQADDAKYGITKYSDTYDENDLKIVTYVDVDGNVAAYEQTYLAPEGNTRVEFIQIEGLKNKDIQSKVNDKLKKAAYEIKSNNTYEYITANFGNILSVNISGYDEQDNWLRGGINIDLTTGEDIKFEDVFVSSATINSYITAGLYKTLAWNEKNEKATDENYMEDFDMDKIQIADFEDKSLKVIKDYQKAVKEGKINFNISPSGVSIYDLIDKNIVKNQYLNYIDIDFANKKEEIAIYKRFLKNESIFENNNLGQKGVIVFTNPTGTYDVADYYKILNYGKISNNIFMEDVIENTNDDYAKEEGFIAIMEYFQKDSDQKKNNLSVENGKGMFYQRIINIWHNEQEGYYSAYLREVQTTCDINYYNDLAFKDYIDMKNQPFGGGIEYYIFRDYEYEKEKYPNLNIKGTFVKSEYGYDADRTMYFNEKGEYIGETEEEAKAKIQEGKEEIKTENTVKEKTEVKEQKELEQEEKQTNTTIDITTVKDNVEKSLEEENKQIEDVTKQIESLEEAAQGNLVDQQTTNETSE